MCFTTSSCIAFVYSNDRRECNLKYNVLKIETSVSHDLYINSCCYELQLIARASEKNCRVPGSTSPCDLVKRENIGFEISYNITSSSQPLRRYQVEDDIACRKDCFALKDCNYAVYEANKYCSHFSNLIEKTEGSVDMAKRACCVKSHSNLKVYEIINSTVAMEKKCIFPEERFHRCITPTWVEYKESEIPGGNIMKIKVTIDEECRQLCSNDPSCFGVTIGNIIANSSESSICFLKHKVNNLVNGKNYKSYKLACCGDSLPVILEDTFALSYKHCSPALSENFTSCDNNLHLFWMSFSDQATIGISLKEVKNMNEIECRRICLLNKTCNAVTVKPHQPQVCYLSRIEYAILKEEKKDFTTVPHCCKMPEVSKKNYEIINANEIPTHFCTPAKLEALRNEGCYNMKWLKYHRKESSFGDLLIYTSQTLDSCLKLCVDNTFCAIFSFNAKEGLCKLKYKLINVVDNPLFDVYVFSCCSLNLPMVSAISYKTSCLENGTNIFKGCNVNGTTLTWYMHYKKTYDISTVKHEGFTQFNCRQKCTTYNECVGVTYDDFGNCWLSYDNKANIYENVKYETAELKCCTINHTVQATNMIIPTIKDYQCRSIESRQKSTCVTPKWVKYEKQKFDLANIRVFKVQYMKECLYSCNAEIGCVAFVYDKKTCSLKHEIESLKVDLIADTYILKCCGDEIPFALSQDGFCRRFTFDRKKCLKDEVLSWEIHVGKSFTMVPTFEVMDHMECRIKCKLNPQCISAFYPYKELKCYMASSYSPMAVTSIESHELAVLACCQKREPKLKTTRIINGDAHGELCQQIKSKHERCSEPVFVLHRDKDSEYADIVRYKNVTLQECMKLCNEQFYCILFHYQENVECLLKHMLRTIVDYKKIDLYILHCCPEVGFSNCNNCPAITSRTEKCVNNKLHFWKIYDEYRLQIVHDTIFNISNVDCRYACIEVLLCVAVSYNYDRQQCNLHISTKMGGGNINGELAFLVCHEDYPFVKTNKIIREVECQKRTCSAAIKHRTNTCLQPAWKKQNDFESKFGTIRIVIGISFDECLNMCNDYMACITFTYSIEDGCHLKHRLGALQTSFKNSLYTLVCLKEKIPIINNDLDVCCVPHRENPFCVAEKVIGWYKIKGQMSNNNFMQLNTVTEDVCRAYCEQNFTCRIFSFEKSTGKCLLSSLLDKKLDVGYDMWTYTCCSKVNGDNVWIDGESCATSCFMRTHESFILKEFTVSVEGHPQAEQIWLDGCSLYYFHLNDTGSIWVTRKMDVFRGNQTCKIRMEVHHGSSLITVRTTVV